MQSQIDDELSPYERRVLEIYRSPQASGLGRLIAASVVWAIFAGALAAMGMIFNTPVYGVCMFAMLVIYLVIRIDRSSRFVGVMPGIIEKYERRIANDKSRLAKDH